MLNDALLALEEVNANPDLGITLEPVIVNPGGELSRYATCTTELLSRCAVRHVVGCYTSSSRTVSRSMTVIPTSRSTGSRVRR